jgi:hypothetical protein
MQELSALPATQTLTHITLRDRHINKAEYTLLAISMEIATKRAFLRAFAGRKRLSACCRKEWGR